MTKRGKVLAYLAAFLGGSVFGWGGCDGFWGGWCGS